MSEFILVILIAIAGGIGAALRQLVGELTVNWQQEKKVLASLPLGTIIINLSGTFLLGILVGLSVQNPYIAVFTTGLCGGYTTFSTTSIETLQLLRNRKFGPAIVNSFGQMLVALPLALLGIWLGQQISWW